MEWLHAPDYLLARSAIQHALGLTYLVAFLVAVRQFRPLLGERGLLPVSRFTGYVPFRRSPSIFHFRYSDRLFAVVAWSGAALAAAAFVGLPDAWPAPATMVLWSALWALYLSIVNVGQTFYAFGWETLLLEAGFLAIFLGPATAAVPAPLIWLFRWLLFRLEFGAGLIKMRVDPCWRDLTCLYYHHETQPMPNPLSWYFHHLPKQVHRLEVLGNHFAQLVVPFLLFAPQPVASIAGAIVIVTQAWLVVSGNFSWLNFMAIILAFAAVDDATLRSVVPVSLPAGSPAAWHDALVVAVTALVVALSYRPARNLVSRHQLMNSSFDPLRLVNTYGAFGSITRVRYEIVIEGSDDPRFGWREYGFKGKPGDPMRRPPQVAPYHLRLDWLMWFAAMGSPGRHPWLFTLMERILEHDRPTLALLGHVPFSERGPRLIRALLYRYRFTTPAERRRTRAWWVRSLVGEYIPPLALEPVDEAAGPGTPSRP